MNNTTNPPKMYLEHAREHIGEVASRIVLLGHAMGAADYAMMLDPDGCTFAGMSYQRLISDADKLIRATIELRAALEPGNDSNEGNADERPSGWANGGRRPAGKGTGNLVCERCGTMSHSASPETWVGTVCGNDGCEGKVIRR